jgi:hypothetical protein
MRGPGPASGGKKTRKRALSKARPSYPPKPVRVNIGLSTTRLERHEGTDLFRDEPAAAASPLRGTERS